MLPNDFAPFKTVHYHFQRWIESGRIERLHARLRRAARARGRAQAQLFRSGAARGHSGGGKNVKGRKRHVVTDTMGLLLGVFVCEAGPHDSQKAPHVLQKLLGKVPRLKTVFADKGYEATPDGLIWRCFGWLLEIVRREEDTNGFDPIPRRWVIERTLLVCKLAATRASGLRTSP